MVETRAARRQPSLALPRRLSLPLVKVGATAAAIMSTRALAEGEEEEEEEEEEEGGC